MNRIAGQMSLVKPVGAAMLLTLVVIAAGLSGCADVSRALSLDPGGVDPSSPIAAKAVAASRGRYDIVEFRNIPPVPTDVLSAADVKSRVAGMVDVRRDLARKTAALPPAQSDTEGFSQRTRDPLLARNLAPPAADQDAQTQAYVERLRAISLPPGGDPATPDKPKPAAPKAAPKTQPGD
jgi:hypothetical protein